jgi:uncharacterized protein YeaO (DUF488 family)
MNAMNASSKTSRPIRIKRVYEPAAEDDGLRVLVDRLWPRGVSKEKVLIDLWLKDIAPSDALRRRVHGDPTKWDAFVADYGSELEREPARSAVASLRERAECQPVTLLYASRDEVRNNAVVLKVWLDKMK